jgi:hypothetical protein
MYLPCFEIIFSSKQVAILYNEIVDFIENLSLAFLSLKD